MAGGGNRAPAVSGRTNSPHRQRQYSTCADEGVISFGDASLNIPMVVAVRQITVQSALTVSYDAGNR